MPADLRVRPAQRRQQCERDQLPGGDVEPVARVVVAEAVRSEVALDVLLVGGRRGAHRVDALVAHDLLLHPEPELGASLRGGGRLRRQRQLDPARAEHPVRQPDEGEGARQPGVRRGLVEHLLRLDRGDAGIERGAEHRVVRGLGVERDQRSQLDQQRDARLQRGLGDDVGGEPVDDLGELRVGAGQLAVGGQG